MASYKGRKRKFHREAGARGAMVRSMLLAMIVRGKITTTEARAKEIRQRIEKLVTRARVDTVANRRVVAGRLGNDVRATAKLFTDIAPRFKGRPGGYTRVTKLPKPQKGDASRQAVVEFVA